MGLQTINTHVYGDDLPYTDWNTVANSLNWLKGVYPNLAEGSYNGSRTTGNGTFATGLDLLASALNVDFDGTSDYLVVVHFAYLSTNTTNTLHEFFLNFDGAQSTAVQALRAMSTTDVAHGPVSIPMLAPATGSHTVNVRLVNGGAGGNVTVNGPIIVTVEVA